uniref:Uncharacterized protein n=1 Tax=Anopheles atroparvus TaxID=41427 RepID=A0A182IQ44_ANOAO
MDDCLHYNYVARATLGNSTSPDEERSDFSGNIRTCDGWQSLVANAAISCSSVSPGDGPFDCDYMQENLSCRVIFHQQEPVTAKRGKKTITVEKVSGSGWQLGGL